VTVAAAALTGGCDPKFLNGVADNTHEPTGGTGGGGVGGSGIITREAVITGAIVSFHTELMAGALAVAGDHDLGPAPGIRSFLATDCMTIAVLDAQTPVHQFDLGTCADANGTVYAGRGTFEPPLDASDAFVLYPDYSFEGQIAAANDVDTDLNHSVTSGTLKFSFSRSGSAVAGLVVSNFLRHFIGDTPNVTFSYDDVKFTGGIGEMGPYPDNGEVMHMAWDGIGAFDVTFDGGPNASYRMQGQDYRVSLDTGAVRLSTVPLQ
jgi:hypothetical protein